MSGCVVMKFGGTSVGSAERIRALAQRVRERREASPLVVVSALSGVTDLLICGAQQALAREPGAFRLVDEIRERHRRVTFEMFADALTRERLMRHVDVVTAEVHTFYTGVHALGELTPRTLDAISGAGERLACEIVAAAVERGQAVDAREVMLTDDSFGRANPLMDETRERLERRVRPLLTEGAVPVLGGFIGATRQGVTTTLGRGGSDWSASIFGAALGAREIQIWTDVDGIMTVDPRLIPAARVIPEVSFDEAAELAYFGAKVLHPTTIRPAAERGIPVRILNSLNPAAAGTLIQGRANGPAQPRAIAFKKGISVVLISQPRMLMAYGFVARVFEVFDRHRTAVDLIATSEVSISLTVDDTRHLPGVEADLQALGEVRVLGQMAIVSLVGQGFVQGCGLAARVFQALRDVSVVMISFGASDVNVSLVVSEAQAEAAVLALHREFFEGDGPTGVRP